MLFNYGGIFHMNFCIYLKRTETELTFKSGEHIFPAAIGGIQKLPESFVSEEFNNKFSKLEGHFTQDELLSLPRQFHGPGKRGNLNPKRATKSKICILSEENNPNSVRLGYISLSKPYYIPQIKININGETQFSADLSEGDGKTQVNDFFKSVQEFNDYYTIHEEKNINQDEFIIGYEIVNKKKKWHIAFSDSKHLNNINKWIERLNKTTLPEKVNAENKSAMVNAMQGLQVSESYFRTCAKIAFNFLAFVKGQEFVLQECFDPIRNWIINGGKNKAFVSDFLNDEELKRFHSIKFPEMSHKLIIINNRGTLCAYISFYGGHFGVLIQLGSGFEGEFEFDGFICDWQNRKEYKFFDYIKQLNN